VFPLPYSIRRRRRSPYPTLSGGAGDWKADEVALAFGGVAPVTVMAPAAAAALTGRPWTEATLREAVAALVQDVVIAPDAPGAPPVRPPHRRRPRGSSPGPTRALPCAAGGRQAVDAGLWLCRLLCAAECQASCSTSCHTLPPR